MASDDDERLVFEHDEVVFSCPANNGSANIRWDHKPVSQSSVSVVVYNTEIQLGPLMRMSIDSNVTLLTADGDGSNQLHIRNVTRNDSGDYVCMNATTAKTIRKASLTVMSECLIYLIVFPCQTVMTVDTQRSDLVLSFLTNLFSEFVHSSRSICAIIEMYFSKAGNFKCRMFLKANSQVATTQ